ncbi:hypothetical protein DUI87_07327 [Hirundo rustica rustica]|uniref:Neural-cadherin n=1 Tax=Hirundo rustica rustica TaxID=333673 RepID=A0A3M0KPU3_HIRRU|nr:hypothetical protein DUI87_07327 [Hirundo rustica rustica]
MGRARRGQGRGLLPLLLLLPLLGGAAGPGCGGCPRLPLFSGRVPENSPAGTRVRGLRVPLRRLLGPGEPAGEWALEGDGASRFSLQRRPGGGRGLLLLRTAEPLDRETQPEYGLRLRRRAGRSPRGALLRVRVLDRNDHRPRLPPARPLEVDELVPLGTEVARLRASDGDEGANARLTYRPWPPGAGSRLLFVVPRSGQVLTVGSLLGLRRLRLCVAALDHGRPRPLRSPARCLRLAVRGRGAAGGAGRRREPRSLQPPGPGARRYTARLPSGARVGDTVFTVPRSRDRAAGGWFELASPGAIPVGVDRTSGRLYLRRELRAGGRAEVLVKVHRGGGGDDDWYLCHVTLLAPEEELLSWGMYPYPYLARVDPDARKGTLIYQLVAHYSGHENTTAGITYTLIAGGEERFRVDKDTGVIMTTGLPLAWNKEYVVTVEAADEYGNKSPYASVSILAGSRPPQFTNMSYSVFVPENTPAGEKVAVVEAVSFQSQPLSYTLLTNPSGLFCVRQESGELSLTHPVDYESEHHLYHLLLKAMEVESTLSSVTEVMVHITDENDCSPEFQRSIYSRDNVPETIPVGTSLLQVLATDCDSGSNSEISYFIQSTDFSITRHGVINSNQRLNFERANHMYEFVVIAVDKGHPPRTGTASVRIRMANVNDEAPVFSQPVYRTFLSEDAGPGTLVATVRAEDPDGDGLLYLITGGNEEGNFELDSQKGIIKLRRNPPPSLKGPQYTLNVTAIDDNASGGPTPLSSFAEVIVGVNDVNNNKPVFRECAYYSDSTWVLENQPPGTHVLQVEAYDADLGINGEVKYGLMHRDGASLGFSIDPDTGVITTTQSFDREKQREYTLSVTATDQAQEPLIGVCQVTVLIADLNDNDPKFENSRYQYFLSEDTPVGMSFLRVAAHDSDQGVNAAVTYSVLEHQMEYFQINPSTGWVYVNRPLPQTMRISCYIVATDGGNRSSTVELTVTVTSAQSQPPQWEQSTYWVTIPENTTRDTKIVTIKATSPLGDPRVTYNLEEGQVPETNMPVRFYLKPNRADGSASLLVAEPLDFETTKFFTLTVRAQNVAMTPLASFATVCVNITDVNDNVPFFMSSNYEVSVPEGADVGTSVVQVLAMDLDSGLHGEVHYLILKDANEDYQFFTIEPETGIISTQASFDREKRASYLIEVQSQDLSESARPGVHGQPNTDTAYVRIFVSDVNDNAPAFPRSVYEVSIDEDRDVGSPVVTATADDKDEGANAKLRYQITSGNVKGFFDVEPEVGTVFIAQPLDYEQEQHYELRLVASDGKWENHTLIIINVVNKNDEAPVFTQNEYQGSVLEELTDLPVLVLKVSATDPDQAADQNAINYSLHGQGASSEFSINEHTGEISAHKRLDREKRSTWRFLVLATDEGGEGLTGFADVIIEVRDVNDNSPLFLCVSDGCFTGSIPEDSPADTPIMEMTAVDLDDPKAGINAVLTYSIIQNVKNEINLNLFSIDSVSGTISMVLGSLDREKEDKYLVVVEARDGGGLTGTGTATILVTDVNDHAPVFLQRIYTAFVSENASINTEVVVVSAVDRDEGENAMVTFSIIDGDNDRKFSIETDEVNNCGFIRLRKRIDFEKPHERVFNLTVKAEDMDFFSIAHCVIYVEDSNDHAPVFYPQFYEVAALGEDVPVGTKVIQVSAVDLDSGLNGRFSFHLQNKSDPGGQFSLTSDGWLVVAGSLDHETVAQYKLIVIATDMGQPPLTGSATVLVTLQDVNDNGPEFEAHYNPVVWENTASPQVVQMNETSTLLYAKDRDTAANGAPFSFRLLSDLDSLTSFSLQDFHNGSAMLTALRTFDREVHKAFYLPILITDSGIPPMSSTNTLTVNIGDQNDHPHSAGYMESLIYSYDGILPTTVLGQVSAPDADDWDRKIYQFEGKTSRYFILNDNSGLLTIKEGTPPGTYNIRVRVIDGVWPDVISTVKVVVKEIKDDALHNAGSVRIKGITPEEFISQSPERQSKYYQMKKILSEIISVQVENVHIFSVMKSPSQIRGVDIWFAVYGPPYYKAEKLNGNVAASRAWEVKLILDNCVNVSVRDNGSVTKKISQRDLSVCEASGEIVGSQSMGKLFSGHQPLQLGGVKTLPYLNSERHFRGFVGCIRNVIVDSKVYDLGHPAESLNSAPGCSLTDEMCQNGGMTSCGIHGKCVGGWDFFHCDCSPGYAGLACEKVLPEWAFGRDSWIHYEPRSTLSTRSTRIQLMVRTRISHSTLLSLASADGNGYIRLEVVEGFFSVNFSLGDKNHSLRMRTLRINNGQWVLLTMERYNNEFTLRVNSGGGDQEVTSVLGTNRWFEMDWASIVLGNHISSHSETDFQGCMRDVQLDGQPLLVEGRSTEFGLILRRQGITMGCHSSACSSQPCYSPFLCVDLWRKYECSTLGSYTVWSQWGSSGFRKGGIYHIPEERESWEDVRENVFNYNEEGGGERDQNAYNIDALKKPLHKIPRSSLQAAAPHSRTPTGPKRDSLPKHEHQKQSISTVSSIPDFKEYVSQIIRDADNDLKSLPADTIHFYCLEGQCSLAGSLSSLDSITGDEDLNYDCLQEWGPKFEKLKELYVVSNENL